MTAHGRHHTTGITGDALANLDVDAGLLGLRLVMRTVHSGRSLSGTTCHETPPHGARVPPTMAP